MRRNAVWLIGFAIEAADGPLGYLVNPIGTNDFQAHIYTRAKIC
jgi:hypothetical protein